MLEVAEGRRELTRLDPLKFALVYLPHHITDDKGEISLSEFHLDLIEYGKTWVKGLNQPKQFRDAFIAPRECGKTTWLFTILPIWAAAHQHVRFIAAYSDAATQAQGHLITFKQELDTNKYLRNDFPDLCDVERSSRTSRAIADNNFKTVRANGFVFVASGVDVTNHGIKHGTLRPEVIILDDVEPGESNYSDYQVKQRKATIFDDIAPQNIRARMVIVGTTTMPNSLIDQLRKYGELVGADRYSVIGSARAQAKDVPIPEELEWVRDQNIKVHYYPAIMKGDDGSERSVWPEKWSLDWLQSQRHMRDFAKNYMNKPISIDGQFWEPRDIEVREFDHYGNTLLSVDPAVTKSKVSDYTGLAVVSRVDEGVAVRYADQVKMSPKELSKKCEELVDEYGCGLIYVEVNQGGELWREVFESVPCRYRAVRQTVSKEIRAGEALNKYQRGQVFHTENFPVLNEQMMSFPNVAHDDVLDAAVSGILYFIGGPKGQKVEVSQMKYMSV